MKRFLKDMDKDLDRIRERQSDIVTSTDPTTPQILLNGEVRKHPLKASQFPTEDPGDLFSLSASYTFYVSPFLFKVVQIGHLVAGV